jgi:hypothetical protein
MDNQYFPPVTERGQGKYRFQAEILHADKIYRVNMSTLTVKVEDVPEKWKGTGSKAHL